MSSAFSAPRRRKKVNKKGERKKRIFKIMPVFLRIKPLGVGGGGGEEIREGDTSALTFTAKSVTCITKKATFDFPSVVIPPGTLQKGTYDIVMKGLVESFLDGYNVSLLAFGQTGSGKTHTLFSPPFSLTKAYKDRNFSSENFGLLPRAGIEIFREIKKRNQSNGGKYVGVLYGQIFENYFMQTADILNNKVPLGFDSENCRPLGATTWILDSEEKIIKFSSLSETRMTGATLLNDTSSRSHCFTCLYYGLKNPKSNTLRVSKFQFVDMGGSERISVAHGSGVLKGENMMRRFEGMCINICLAGLIHCMESLGKPGQRRKTINLLESGGWAYPMGAFGELLMDSFRGRTITRFVITASQAPRNEQQSFNAFQYATKFSKVKESPEKTGFKKIVAMERKIRKVYREAKFALSHLRSHGRKDTHRMVVLRKNQIRGCRMDMKVLNALKEVEKKVVSGRDEEEEEEDEGEIEEFIGK